MKFHDHKTEIEHHTYLSLRMNIHIYIYIVAYAHLKKIRVGFFGNHMHISCASKTKNRANITELDSRNFESHYFEQKITLTYQFRIEGMKTEAKRVYKKKRALGVKGICNNYLCTLN